MKSIFYPFFLINLLFSCDENVAQNTPDVLEESSKEKQVITLSDFLSENKILDAAVENIFDALSEKEKIAQLIMPAMGEHGQPTEVIDELVKDGLIGGILLLNGTKEEFTGWVKKYNSWNDSLGHLPFLYSADAEPSLINRKIKNTIPVKNANKMETIEEVKSVAKSISKELLDIGINYNFAPVVDMSPNKTVGWRSFGHQPDSVIPWSNTFINVLQDNNIIATAKHFPGHGYVEGDTHKKLVYIEGEMKEVKNYPPLIENGLLSIMIAHIAVTNNEHYSTDGMPATTSRKIITQLLRDSLNFEGLIITDALNMGGVKNIPNADLLAIEAGCDILLMPLDARKAHKTLIENYQQKESLKKQIDASVKKIIRMKICLGIIDS